MRIVGALVAAAIAVVALSRFWFEPALLWAMHPAGSFDPAAAPAAPDWDDPEAWTAHPGKRDPSDVVPPGFTATDPPGSAPAECFYIHPTSYLGRAWNGPVDDPTLQADTDRLSTLIQASAFNGACNVWGPRYRQANGTAFTQPSEDGERAIEFAYGDVRDAFRSFRRETAGRPFLIVAHSQGAVLGARLVAREIAGSADAAQLVAAYLVGAPIGEAQAGLPFCDRATAIGCIVTFNARAPGYEPGRFDFFPTEPRVCIDPITWQRGDRGTDARENRGSVFLHAGEGKVRRAFARAACRGEFLEVTLAGDAPRDVASRILDRVMGPGNFHPIEFQLFWLDLRENAALRVAAHRAARH